LSVVGNGGRGGRRDRRESGLVAGHGIVVGGSTLLGPPRGSGIFLVRVGSWDMIGRKESLEFIQSPIQFLKSKTTSILFV
jgi:hypothetical protein